PLPDGVLFGSEPKAILAHPGFRAEIDAEGLAEMFSQAGTGTPGHGIYRGLSQVRPGTIVRVGRFGARTSAYWTLEAREHADDLVEAQWAPLAASDLPAMGDMWVSIYLLFREIRQQSTVALSGESADEVFGGYPWYHVPALLAAPTFPWAAGGSWAPLLTPAV